jgi:hypothetical protein
MAEKAGYTIPAWLAEKLTAAGTGVCRGSSGSGERGERLSRVDMHVMNFNGNAGDLRHYDCPKCRNRGEIAENRNGNLTIAECECMVIRRNMAHIRESGLAELLGLYTMSSV